MDRALLSLREQKCSEAKMARVITGTASAKQQARIIKATGKNVTKVRCQFCKHTLAHPVPDGKGGTVLKCGTCGRTYKFADL